jgi:predicted DNA-binding transcriptional regulator YafY
MANTATRLITLIMQMQRQPGQKAADLAAGLGVSVRTLHRYMAMLEEMGIPIYSERGPQGGFSLVRGYRMAPLVLTPEEAAALYLGAGLVTELWGPLYEEAASGALAKLDNLLPDEQREETAWARRSLVAIGLHRGDGRALGPYLATLRQAARERRRVRLLYRGRSQAAPTARDLDPYALVHRAGRWYAVGYCHLRQAPRSFRVDRFAGLELLDDSFEAPPGFDAAAFLAQSPAEPAVEGRMCFAPAFASIAADNATLWESQTTADDGSVEVTFSAPDLEWAVSMVLSFSGAAVALAPAEVRELVRRRASLIAAEHEIGDSPS